MSQFLSHILWNVGWSAAIAVVVFLLSRRAAFQRRPALMHVLWFGVLLRLIVPAVIAVPVLPMLQAEPDIEATYPVPQPQYPADPLIPIDLPALTKTPSVSTPETTWMTWPVRLLLISLTGTLALLSLCYVRSRRLSQLLSRSAPVPQQLLDRTRQLAHDMRLSGCPELHVIEGLATPSLSLYRRTATILLPQHLLNEFDDEQWSCILSHELAHFARRDGWFNVVATGVLYLFWWNPVAWWAWREMRACQEASCDALALARQPASRRLYAETLLQVVEALNRPAVWQPNVVLGFGNQSVLMRRFVMIANPSVRPRAALAATLCLSVLSLAFACVPVRAEKDAKPEKADLEKIQGTWKAVEAQEKREATAKELEEMNIRFTFTGDKLKLQKVQPDHKEMETGGVFALNTSTNPKQIDFGIYRGKELLNAQGIYELDGDSLKICFGEKRPTKFKIASGTDHRLYVFHKQASPPQANSGEATQPDAPQESAAQLAEGAAEVQSRKNINQIVLALHLYHEEHNVFPPAVLYGKDNKGGKFPHSWRVAILPYLNQQKLYDSYRFDEPWDSPANVEVMAKMPDVYRAPGDDRKDLHTDYVALVGKLIDDGSDPAKLQTMFSSKQGTKMSMIRDGLSNTLAIVETKLDGKQAIQWTQPKDLSYDPTGELPKLGGLHADGFYIGFADGAALFINSKIKPTTIKALISPAGGESNELFNE
ncbi:MAG: M56 family metallopeptidase [Planctomycetaceae bacterium]